MPQELRMTKLLLTRKPTRRNHWKTNPWKVNNSRTKQWKMKNMTKQWTHQKLQMRNQRMSQWKMRKHQLRTLQSQKPQKLRKHQKLMPQRPNKFRYERVALYDGFLVKMTKTLVGLGMSSNDAKKTSYRVPSFIIFLSMIS